ncbi:MAG: sulfotransferase [Rhodanobacteraceae bacterium]
MSAARSVDRHWKRARGYLRLWQLPAAQAQLESLRLLAPEDVRTRLLAALLAWHQDRVRDSASLALDAATSVPDDAELLCVAIEALLQAGETAAAHALLGRPAWQHITDAEILIACAGFLQDFGEPARALASLGRIAALEAGDASLHLFRGQQLEYMGKLAEAESCYRQCLQLDPGCGRAAYWLVRLQRQTTVHNFRSEIETGLQRARRGTHMHAAFEFALYHTLEDLGRYDEAWSALVRGNAEMRSLNAPDTAREHAEMQRFRDRVSSCAIGTATYDREGPRPIFIVGLPRSGTTLLERMLSNHSQVATAGELVDFGNALLWTADTRLIFGEKFLARVPELDWQEVGRRYLSRAAWRAQGNAYFIDKQPTNWTVAGLIHAALPQAGILNVVRDSMDVCFSNWRAMFGDAYSWGYDFADLAQQYREYDGLMRYWHAAFPGAMLDVPYAGLVREPASVLREVFDFCGLPWEAGCEDLRRNVAPVTTLSSAQVREPVHTRGLGGWRRYATQLEPLRQLLQGESRGSAGDEIR